MRLDHRRSDLAQTRPHRAGCPVAGPAVAVSIYVRPVRAAGALQSPAASCRLGSCCEPPHGRRRPAADLQCRMGTGCAAGWGLVLSRSAQLGPVLVESVREHGGAVPGCANCAASCGLILVGLRFSARPEVLLRRRRIHAARPSPVRRCSYAPASCGLPCGRSCGGRFYSCAARPGRRGFAIAGGILPPRFSLRTTTRSAASCRRPSVPDGNGLCCGLGLGVVEEWRSWGPFLSRACANTVALFRGATGAASMRLGLGRSQVQWRGLRCCCGAAASMRLDHRRSDVAHSARIVRAALWLVRRWPFPSMCGPSGPQGLCNRRRHPAASVLAASHHTVGGVLPPTFSAGWEQPALVPGA